MLLCPRHTPTPLNRKGTRCENHRFRRYLSVPDCNCDRSLPVLEPVCECRKRKLKKGDQRRAAETYRFGAGSSPCPLSMVAWAKGLARPRSVVNSLGAVGFDRAPSWANRVPPGTHCADPPSTNSVSASSRTGLRVSKTEIGKKATRDGRRKLPTWRKVEPLCASRDPGNRT
jgi:hypothetical protein